MHQRLIFIVQLIRQEKRKMENKKKPVQFNYAQTGFILSVMTIMKEQGNKDQIKLIEMLERGLEELKEYM